MSVPFVLAPKLIVSLFIQLLMMGTWLVDHLCGCFVPLEPCDFVDDGARLGFVVGLERYLHGMVEVEALHVLDVLKTSSSTLGFPLSRFIRVLCVGLHS